MLGFDALGRLALGQAPSSTLNNYTLTVDVGSLTLTGQAAAIKFGHSISAAVGSFTYTGQAVALKATRIVSVAFGSFALTGQTALLLRGYPISAAQGPFTLTGQSVGLTVARTLPVEFGAYTLTGQDAGIAHGFPVLAGCGAYAVTGVDVGLRVDRKIAGAFGSYTFTGQSALLKRGFSIAVTHGSLTLAGQVAGLYVERRFQAGQGSYTLTGYSVFFTPTSTGALDAVEGADTAEFAGAVLVEGTLAATEGADTASMSGTVSGDVVIPGGPNASGYIIPPLPDRVFIPEPIVAYASSGQGQQSTRASFRIELRSYGRSAHATASQGDLDLHCEMIVDLGQGQTNKSSMRMRMMASGRSSQRINETISDLKLSVSAIIKSGGDAPMVPEYHGDPMPGSYFEPDNFEETLVDA